MRSRVERCVRRCALPRASHPPFLPRPVACTGVTLFAALPVALIVRDHAVVATFSTASVAFIVLFAIVVVGLAFLPSNAALTGARQRAQRFRGAGAKEAWPFPAFRSCPGHVAHRGSERPNNLSTRAFKGDRTSPTNPTANGVGPFAPPPTPPCARTGASASLHVWQLDGLLVAFPVMAFSFTAHPYYLGIYSNLTAPSHSRMLYVTDMVRARALGLAWARPRRRPRVRRRRRALCA